MNKDLDCKAREIATDTALAADQRIGMLLELRPEGDAEADIVIFGHIVHMLSHEPLSPDRNLSLGQATVLLCEAMTETNRCREVEAPARDVMDLYTVADAQEHVSEQDVEMLRRLAKVVGKTVYHHLYRDVIEATLRHAAGCGMDMQGFKGMAEKLLTLDILLEHDPYGRRRGIVEKQCASLFTPEELVRIITSPRLGSLCCDPVEYTRRWEDIYYDVEDRLEDMFRGEPHHMGFCFRYWSAKSGLLEEEYGIEWRSPAVMNPTVHFD